MTPPASPPLTTNPASLTRSISHSATTSNSIHQTSSPQQIAVPSSTAAALSKMAQAAHSWRPADAARLAEQAWQDTLLSTTGLTRSPELAASSANTQSTESKDSTANLWDFIDPTLKSSCICVK